MNAFIFQSLVIGIAGTAAMDLWALLLNRQAGVASPNWAYVGRWFLHLPRGKIYHADIAASKSFPFESEAGWIAHYVTGIIYGGALLKIMGESYAHAPTLFPALILAWLTVAAGWFILQPGMGAGWAASKRDNPWTIRFLNLASHTCFGIGMYWGALFARAILK